MLANPNLIKMKVNASSHTDTIKFNAVLQQNSDGYLVIIQPKFKDVGCMAKTVMEPEQYQQLQERGKYVNS